MGGSFAGHLPFGLFDQALDHVAAYIAVFPAAQIAIVALLEIDAQFPGNFKCLVIQGSAGLGAIGAVSGLIARLTHCFFTSLNKVNAIVTDSGRNTLEFCAR